MKIWCVRTWPFFKYIIDFYIEHLGLLEHGSFRFGDFLEASWGEALAVFSP